MSAPAIMPRKATDLDAAFGPGSINDFLPDFLALPEEYQRERSPWCRFVQSWFFGGLTKEVVGALKPRPGIETMAALRHIGVCLRSFEPKHEHKIAGCGYLASLWFEGDPPEAQR